MSTFFMRCDDPRCCELMEMLEQPQAEWTSEGFSERDVNYMEVEDPFCPYCNKEGTAYDEQFDYLEDDVI